MVLLSIFFLQASYKVTLKILFEIILSNILRIIDSIYIKLSYSSFIYICYTLLLYKYFFCRYRTRVTLNYLCK